MPAVTIRVWLENTHGHDYLSTLVDRRCVPPPGTIPRWKSHAQHTAVPGTEVNPQKRNAGRAARKPSEPPASRPLPRTGGNKIPVARGPIRATAVAKACLGFISTICSCCSWQMLLKDSRRAECSPSPRAHTPNGPTIDGLILWNYTRRHHRPSPGRCRAGASWLLTSLLVSSTLPWRRATAESRGG